MQPAIDVMQDLDDYPLRPYLEFELLRQRLDRVPEVVMDQFLARYRDWSFGPSLRRRWLRSLARNGDYDALRRHAGDSDDAVVLCHLARADPQQQVKLRMHGVSGQRALDRRRLAA